MSKVAQFTRGFAATDAALVATQPPKQGLQLQVVGWQARDVVAWQPIRLWKDSGPDWLPCYDIPGLPPDNLKLEALFGRLRCHQRRISGRKSTRELRDFGHCQVLFLAESEQDLLQQLRQVPLADYQACRRRLAEAEAPRQLLHRLHRDPFRTMRDLVDQHAARRAALASSTALSPPVSDS